MLEEALGEEILKLKMLIKILSKWLRIRIIIISVVYIFPSSKLLFLKIHSPHLKYLKFSIDYMKQNIVRNVFARHVSQVHVSIINQKSL